MYVRPSARGTGVGYRLIEAVLDLARQHVELIQLTVVRTMRRRGGSMRVWAFWTTAWRNTLSSRTAATTTRC
jgi:GNAT superfamily N-acetyltransferase